MPIQILWGNDLNAQNTFIQELIEKEVSKEWKEINVTNLNGDDDEQVNKAFDEILTPPFGIGYRVVTLKNNPIFTTKNEYITTKFEKIYDNIPTNTYFILQNTKKPDSRLKSTKFLQKLIKNNLAKEKSFSLPEIWDYEGQKRFLEDAANEMNIKIDKNDSAEIYRFKDFNILEFDTKANALDYNSMDALMKATDKPLIIINESMQFSAGVNLNYVMEFVKKKDFKSVEKFIKYFQKTCEHLKYSDKLVISAPSGLSLGGGEEVLLQSNYVVSHTNIVMGLVETIVGLVPAGGGCKELLWRWTQTDDAGKDPDFAPLKVFDIIGYAKTATSPLEAKPLLFLDDNHEVIINRNNLLPMARAYIEQNKNFKPPVKCKFKLSGDQVRKKMQKVLDELYNSKKILDHGMIVGKELANVLSGGDTNLSKEISEEQMYKLELESFMKLLETDKTQKRIVHTLKTSKPLIN